MRSVTSPQRTEGPEGLGHHAPPGQRQEMESPKQANLQFVDDTWERLLNAMERLEQVTEGFQELSATRLDRHADRTEIVEDEFGVRTEVHLQIKCLQRVLHPVREEGQWMLGDFMVWYAARAGRALAAADEYAAPIVRCIIGDPYELPSLEHVQPSERDILQATEALAVGLHGADEIEDHFRRDPDALAEQHTHERSGDPAAGVARLADIEPSLAERLVLRQDPESSEPEPEPEQGDRNA